ncbi:DUF3221 domain-containing protein [Wukongibacter sp. M2B1]|uniref:DUF3221 domain-containing protein n=1 Tax=Wukongibacter sp. M2B1 TaxID=3088895 RepID=UPI003D7A04B2
MKRLLVSGLIIAMSMTSFVGCANTDTINTDGNGKDEEVTISAKVKASDIVGIVLEVKEDGKLILVDSQTDLVKGQVWVSITDETNFFEDISNDIAIGYHDVSRDFEVGNHVEIISTGEIADSYPMQAKASAVCVNGAKMSNDNDDTETDNTTQPIEKDN